MEPRMIRSAYILIGGILFAAFILACGFFRLHYSEDVLDVEYHGRQFCPHAASMPQGCDNCIPDDPLVP